MGAGTAITVNADDVAVTANGIGPTQIDETATTTGREFMYLIPTRCRLTIRAAIISSLSLPARIFLRIEFRRSPLATPRETLTLSSNATLNDTDYGDITTLSSFTVWTIDADSVALTTDTTGNYVGTVADGTGIDGTAAGEGATYTPTLILLRLTLLRLAVVPLRR